MECLRKVGLLESIFFISGFPSQSEMLRGHWELSYAFTPLPVRFCIRILHKHQWFASSPARQVEKQKHEQRHSAVASHSVVEGGIASVGLQFTVTGATPLCRAARHLAAQR